MDPTPLPSVPKNNSETNSAPISPVSLGKTLGVWFLTMLAIRGLYEANRIPQLAEYTSALTAILLVYPPLWIFSRRRETPPFFEKNLRELFQSLLWCLATALLIFPPLELLNRIFQHYAFGNHYVGGNYQGLANFAFFQIMVVAIPEEIFYRGYLQTQFNRIWGRPWKFFGAPLGRGFFFTCLLFAFSHSLIQLQWWHFSIFFPSLVFGWLREKTGAVTASALFHALSNTYSYWVMLNYR